MNELCSINKYMKKILFVINNLDGGGAEKILLETVKYLDKKKFDINVMTILNRGIYIDEINKLCKYEYIFPNLFKGKFNKLYYSIILRILKFTPLKFQHIFYKEKKYDYVIAFLEGASTKLVSSMNCKKKLAWVHVDPINLPNSTKSYINLKSESISYNMFEKIICVSSDVKSNFIKKYNIKKNVYFNMNILNENIIKEKSIEYTPKEINKNLTNIVTIGRLAKQKNYSSLIEACFLLKKDNIVNYQLFIIGQGEEYNLLYNKIKEYNLEKNIKLLGFKKNPYPYIVNANFVVCSSIAEGFSTFITESLILKRVVLTTDCAGMRDMLGDSKYGIICQHNVLDLYSNMKLLLEDNSTLKYYEEKAKERSEYFNIDDRINEFENLLN